MLLSLLLSNSSEPVKTMLSGNVAVCMCVRYLPRFLLLTKFPRMLRKFQKEDKEMSAPLIHEPSLFALIVFFRLSTLDVVPGQDKLKSTFSSAVAAAFFQRFFALVFSVHFPSSSNFFGNDFGRQLFVAQQRLFVTSLARLSCRRHEYCEITQQII